MASNSETGHARNLANFQNLLVYIKGYGSDYNPSKQELKIPDLEALIAQVQQKLTDVVTHTTTYKTKVGERQAAFSDLKPLATRIINALQVTNAPDHIIDNAKAINRKIQGSKDKSTPNRSPLDESDSDTNEPETRSHSTSQPTLIAYPMFFIFSHRKFFKNNFSQPDIGTFGFAPTREVNASKTKRAIFPTHNLTTRLNEKNWNNRSK